MQVSISVRDVGPLVNDFGGPHLEIIDIHVESHVVRTLIHLAKGSSLVGGPEVSYEISVFAVTTVDISSTHRVWVY